LNKRVFSIFFLPALIAATPSGAADAFGRLFFTPAQRNALDAGKSLAKAAPVAPGPRNVFLNGVVTRSDAGRTVWVNGKAYHDSSPDGIQVKTDPAAPANTEIRVRGRERRARLKVGQQLDLNSGRVSDKTSSNPEIENVPNPSLPSPTKKSADAEVPSPAAGDKSGNTPAPVTR